MAVDRSSVIIGSHEKLSEILMRENFRHQSFLYLQRFSMGYRKIGADVKMAAIRIYEMDLMLLEDILAIVNFSERTWWRTLKCYRTTGSVEPPASNKRGRPRIMVRDDIDYLLALVCHRPSWFLDELLGLLATNRFISVHSTTIFRELERMDISLKKLRIIAKERNEDVRADFIRRIAQYSAAEIGFFLINFPRTRGLFTVGVGVPRKDDVQLNKVPLCEVVGCLEKVS